jgi:hypothetical protein
LYSEKDEGNTTANATKYVWVQVDLATAGAPRGNISESDEGNNKSEELPLN